MAPVPGSRVPTVPAGSRPVTGRVELVESAARRRLSSLRGEDARVWRRSHASAQRRTGAAARARQGGIACRALQSRALQSRAPRAADLGTSLTARSIAPSAARGLAVRPRRTPMPFAALGAMTVAEVRHRSPQPLMQ